MADTPGMFSVAVLDLFHTFSLAGSPASKIFLLFCSQARQAFSQDMFRNPSNSQARW